MKKMRNLKGLNAFSCFRKIWMIMRLSLILLVFFLMQVQATTKAQTQKVHLNVKNTTLANVLRELENQTQLHFIYSNEIVNGAEKVSIQANGSTLDEVLTTLLSQQELEYKIVEDKILILSTNQRLKREQQKDSGIQSQQSTIKGKVTDHTGEPLPGVNVYEKSNPSNGVITGIDGSYTIKATSPNAILTYSFIGFQVQELSISGRSEINVTLVEESIGLNEVVAVGYGIAKKSDLTGSVVRADLEAFKESPNTNIGVALQGAVAGLNVGQTTSAGQSPSISVRGRTSLSGSQNPLIVLDGMIFDGSLSEINPNDVASIDVLKDASSMAIYGAQAANGVIIVTTRKGKSDKPSFNYSASYTFQDADAMQFENRNEFIQKVRDVNFLNAYTEASGYTELNPNFNLESVLFDQTTKDGYEAGNDFDWWDAGTQNAFINTHQLSISGKSDNLNYYMSGSYTKQQNLIINDDFERKTFRINLENKLNDWLTIGAQTNGSFRDFSGGSPNMRMLVLCNPLVTGYDSEGNFLVRMGSLTNPLLPTMNKNVDKRNSLNGNFYADIDLPFIKGLKYRFFYGNSYWWSQDYYSSEYDGESKIGSAYKFNSSRYDYTVDNILTYNKKINDKHKFDLTLLYGARENQYEETKASNTQFVDISLGYNALELGNNPRANSGAYKESFVYQMLRLNYNFQDKYLLTSTVRRDGFSGFAANNKIGYFPSIGGAWIVSNENFLTSVDWLDFLKLRLSYGVNGNLVGRYSSLGLVSSGASYYFGDGAPTEFGREKITLGNSSLGWEKTKGINLGADFNILKGKVNGNIEYYKTQTTDLIYSIAIPNITGYSSITSNVGQIDNNGIEVSITGRILKRKDFNWEITGNISHNTNKIVALEGKDEDGDGKEDDLISSGLFIGESLGTIYTYEIDGIWQVDDEKPSGYYTGTYKIKDQNDDGEIRPEDDRVIIGHTEPAYRFSIQNTLTYKNFTFRMFINSVQGGKNGYLANNNPWSDGGYSGTENASKHAMFSGIDYWTPSNPDAEYRVPGTKGAIDPSTYRDRSFIRLQDVSLSYNFNPFLLNKIGLKGAKVYVSGKNLLTLTKWKGWDPETGQGYNTAGVPVMRGYSLGLDLSF
jgi:TonB-linked SusC/RagA family outer membrane protein